MARLFLVQTRVITYPGFSVSLLSSFFPSFSSSSSFPLLFPLLFLLHVHLLLSSAPCTIQRRAYNSPCFLLVDTNRRWTIGSPLAKLRCIIAEFSTSCRLFYRIHPMKSTTKLKVFLQGLLKFHVIGIKFKVLARSHYKFCFDDTALNITQSFYLSRVIEGSA